ncbi:DUF7344 domain-containing protein [Halobiforma nitratireducens]|uniref:DUF7344 domain-containing protein n=1 Tax=Halobiforma nitratireducens JCM 10879 TaxID=1227454 RepID=M0M9E0_9EURY|nr:hypothetical protein [Halobiforma nitratireducens]EMA40995.1 hypothetical protein C446_06490 [Halobiforma nitratireducens JCM 10879]
MRETERTSTTLTTEATPSLDRVFDLLSDRRRRYVLYYLNDRDDGVATIGEITNHILSLERRESGSTIGSGTEVDAGSDSETGSDIDAGTDSAERIRTELCHVHLPKLEEVGVVEHDQRSETVRYWTQPSLEEWLEHAEHKEL